MAKQKFIQPRQQLPGTPNRVELLSLLHPLTEMLEQPNFSPGLTSWHILYERRVEALLKFFGAGSVADDPDKRPVPPAIATGFYASMLDLIKVRCPEQFKWWGHWDYKIFAPVSLDDEARVVVHLKNQDGTKREVVLAL